MSKAERRAHEAERTAKLWGQATPRRAQIRRDWWLGGILIGLFFSLFGWGFWIGPTLVALETILMSVSGVPVVGQVSDKAARHSNGTHYFVTVAYYYAGQRYSSEHSVGWRDYKQVAIGEKLPVRLISFAPGVAAHVKELDERDADTTLMIALMSNVGAVLITLVWRKQKCRELELVRSGQLVEATITNVRESNRAFKAIYCYTFAGTTHEKTVTLTESPKIGDTTQLVINPDKPKDAELVTSLLLEPRDTGKRP